MERAVERKIRYYDILNQWIWMIEKGEKIENLLIRRGIRSVAIYGMGDMARHLLHALNGTSIVVDAVIDEKKGFYFGEILTVEMDAYDGRSDLVIFTDPTETQSVLEKLSLKTEGKLLSIEDLLFDNWNIAY